MAIGGGWLRIRRSQVRVLPSALEKVTGLQVECSSITRFVRLFTYPHTASGTTTGHARHALKSSHAVMRMVNPTRSGFALAKECLDAVQIQFLTLGL
jgi:predicted nuclease with RNAse H fold